MAKAIKKFHHYKNELYRCARKLYGKKEGYALVHEMYQGESREVARVRLVRAVELCAPMTDRDELIRLLGRMVQTSDLLDMMEEVFQELDQPDGYDF